MLSRLRGIFQFDQLVWDAAFDGKEFWTVDVYLKVGDGYQARAHSRKKLKALGFALAEIAEQLIAG